MFRVLRSIYLALIITLPVAGAILPLALAETRVGRIASVCVAPICFVLTFVVVAGVLSRPHHWAIQAGTFPRDESTPLYRGRRLYGLCWTAVYYLPPLYWLCLSAPQLKKLLFRLFGYRGTLNFTIYPDTWLRDLPLVTFGHGAYLSNRATIGTNVAFLDGRLLAAPVTIGAGGLIGHLVVLAPGSEIGENAEVGVGAALGLSSKLASHVRVGPRSVVSHRVEIGEKASVGMCAYVGSGAVIHAGVNIPDAAIIPAGAIIKSQNDIATLVSSETRDLQQLRLDLTAVLARRVE
jgi:acetyltransferase-like isoleucine patch superfamily enzyme